MKAIILAVIALVITYSSCFAQNHSPTVVSTAFNQKFPNATKVKWNKENTHEYEATFEWKGEKRSANFSASGEWLETESPIPFHLLPEKVQSAFNADHKGVKAKAVAKIETSKGITKFEIEFKQGLKTAELFYTDDGTAIKEQ